MFNLGIYKPNYSVSYSFWKPTENPQDRIALMPFTKCTDYLTDWLMYPNKCPLENIKEKFTTDKTRIIVSFPSSIYRDNFISFGLPLIHKIEKANKFKLTTYEIHDDCTLVITGSKLWQHSTFALSLYLKLFRNTYQLTSKISSFKDYKKYICTRDITLVDPFLTKIIFKGFITKVNRGCGYKHGWLKSKEGNHSNNGIYYTIFAWNLHNKVDPGCERNTQAHINANFMRISNLKEIADKTEKVNLNALRFL